MTRGRLILVHAVVAIIVLGHLYDIARQQEHWPFSNYPMWARLSKDWHVTAIVPVGLTGQPDQPEVELSDPAYFAPLPLHFQRETFRTFKRNTPLRERQLADYLKRYEQLRRDGRHDGPPLVGLRVYERYWTLDKQAGNTARPDRTTLVYEYRAGPTTTNPTTTEAAAGAR